MVIHVFILALVLVAGHAEDAFEGSGETDAPES